MKVIWRPLCGGKAEAREKQREFSSIKEMFDFLVEYWNDAFEISDLSVIFYCSSSIVADKETYLAVSRSYDGLDVGNGPVPVGFVEFE